MISILLGSRSGSNINSGLRQLLLSLGNASSRDAYEILIKLDADDPGLPDQIATISDFHGRIDIRSIITPRAQGYCDLHKAYLDLWRIANPKSTMAWVLSDDVILLGASWDKYIGQAAGKFDDGIFVLCPALMVDYSKATPRSLLEWCENYPIWSAKWIGICGGFGFTFSTDGWTNQLMYRLFHRGIDRRALVDKTGLQRAKCGNDVEGSERWTGIRAATHDLMLSAQMNRLLDWQADAIEGAIKTHGNRQ